MVLLNLVATLGSASWLARGETALNLTESESLPVHQEGRRFSAHVDEGRHAAQPCTSPSGSRGVVRSKLTAATGWSGALAPGPARLLRLDYHDHHPLMMMHE